jgi:hypothetical protein
LKGRSINELRIYPKGGDINGKKVQGEIKKEGKEEK